GRFEQLTQVRLEVGEHYTSSIPTDCDSRCISMSAASVRGVAASNKAKGGGSNPSSAPMRKSTIIMANESPPILKKLLSSSSGSGGCSTSFQTDMTTDSVGDRACVVVVDIGVPSVSRRAAARGWLGD